MHVCEALALLLTRRCAVVAVAILLVQQHHHHRCLAYPILGDDVLFINDTVLQTRTLTKSITLQNSALDVTITVAISPTSVMTTALVCSSLLMTSPSSTSNCSSRVTVESTFVSSSSSSSSSSIVYFLDDDGNNWTMFPFVQNISWVFRKLKSQVRVTANHAQVKSYFPVSEYNFAVPLDASICNGGAQSSMYKCCLQQTISMSTYLAYSLVSSVEPTTCSVNASFAYLDHVDSVSSSAVIAFTNVTAPSTPTLLLLNDTRIAEVARDVRVIRAALLSDPSQAHQIVLQYASGSAANVPSDSLLASQQLCRSGAFLDNPLAAEPFFVNNWAFGSSARQVGYNVTTYVADRYCNDAPLGYYTSYDGNNADQMSYWRSRTSVSAVLASTFSWKSSLLNTSSSINSATGLPETFVNWISLTTSSAPPVTIRMSLSPPMFPTLLRPAFRVVTLLSADTILSQSFVTSDSSSLSLCHGVQVTQAVEWWSSAGTSSSSTSTLLRPADFVVTANCSVTRSGSTQVLFSSADDGSMTTTMRSISSSFPIVMSWFWNIPGSFILASASLTCTYTLQQLDATLTASSLVYPWNATVSRTISPSLSVMALATQVSFNLVSTSLDPSRVLLPDQVYPMVWSLVANVVDASSSLIVSDVCPLDLTFNRATTLCDIINDTVCSLRYVNVPIRSHFDMSLSLCTMNATILSALSDGGAIYSAVSAVALVMDQIDVLSVVLGDDVVTVQAAAAATSNEMELLSTGVLFLPRWMSTPDVASQRVEYRYVPLTHSPASLMSTSVIVVAVQLSFSAKAAVFLIFLLASLGVMVVTVSLGIQWRHWLPLQDDAETLLLYTHDRWLALKAHLAEIPWKDYRERARQRVVSLLCSGCSRPESASPINRNRSVTCRAQLKMFLCNLRDTFLTIPVAIGEMWSKRRRDGKNRRRHRSATEDDDAQFKVSTRGKKAKVSSSHEPHLSQQQSNDDVGGSITVVTSASLHHDSNGSRIGRPHLGAVQSLSPYDEEAEPRSSMERVISSVPNSMVMSTPPSQLASQSQMLRGVTGSSSMMMMSGDGAGSSRMASSARSSPHHSTRHRSPRSRHQKHGDRSVVDDDVKAIAAASKPKVSPAASNNGTLKSSVVVDIGLPPPAPHTSSHRVATSCVSSTSGTREESHYSRATAAAARGGVADSITLSASTTQRSHSNDRNHGNHRHHHGHHRRSTQSEETSEASSSLKQQQQQAINTSDPRDTTISATKRESRRERQHHSLRSTHGNDKEDVDASKRSVERSRSRSTKSEMQAQNEEKLIISGSTAHSSSRTLLGSGSDNNTALPPSGGVALHSFHTFG